MYISFATPKSQLILSSVMPISDLDLMGVMCKKSPSEKIWSHVFLTIDLSFANNISVWNLQFNCHNLSDSKRILYFLASGLSSDITCKSIFCVQ